MNAAMSIPSGAARQPRAFLFFLLAAGVTALSFGIDALLPAFFRFGIIRVGIHALILIGLWFGVSRTGLAARSRVATWFAFALPFTAWLAVVWLLSLDGTFRPSPNLGLPALPLAIFLPLLIGLPVLLRSKRLGTILDATPTSWLVGLQLYRVRGGVFLLAWVAGTLPGTFALPAGIGDVVVGLLALPIAACLQSRSPGARSLAVTWNVLGILDLANAVLIGILSTPSPIQLIVPDRPSSIGIYPLVMIPAFAVPMSVLLHALSLRQLRRLAPPTG